MAKSTMLLPFLLKLVFLTKNATEMPKTTVYLKKLDAFGAEIWSTIGKNFPNFRSSGSFWEFKDDDTRD